MSFKKRLTISLIAVAILPVCVVALFWSNHSVKTAKAQYAYTVERLLDSNATNLDRALKNAYEALIQLVSTPDVVAVLTSIAQGELDLNLETRVNKTYAAIYSLQNLEKDIFEGIGIYSSSWESVVLSSYGKTDPNVKLFYEKVKEAAGKPVWISLPSQEGKRDIYIAAAALRPYNDQVTGIVYIKMKYEFFEGLMNSAGDTYGESLFLLGNDQFIAGSHQEGFTSQKENDWYEELTKIEGQSGSAVVDGEKYLINVKKSTVSDWLLVYAGQDKKITQAALAGAWPVIIAVLTAAGAALAAAAGLSYSAYRPINRMLQLFAGIDRDSLGMRLEEPVDSDLLQITESMNQMMDRVNWLVCETEKEKEARFSAEMAALRAQINPHFLYNTLNDIKYLAVSGKNKDAEKACVSLIHLLRTSIGNNRETITLKEELSYVKHYTELVQLRMDKQFEIEDNVGEEYLEYQIPKFTLQPIVENSIIHGFTNGTVHNTIFFGAYIRDGRFVITVTDNGKGMREEKVRELDSMLKMREGLHFSKVGILNVSERIKHIFGEEYGLEIVSYEEEGTQVVIVIPE